MTINQHSDPDPEPRSAYSVGSAYSGAADEALEPEARLEFEWRFLWLRICFLVSPLLLLVAYGLPALAPAAVVATAIGLDCGLVYVLLRRYPEYVLQYQTALRLLDVAIIYVILRSVHIFVGDAYYDAVYVLVVVAATATHGRRGTYLLALISGIAVSLGRLELVAEGTLHPGMRHVTDSVFYALLFLNTGLTTAFLMRKTAEVTRLREQAVRAEVARASLERRAQELADANEELEAFNQTVMENVADAIITFDDRGLILSSNPATQRLFGYADSELAGQPITTLLPRQMYPGGRRRGETREVQGQRKDGSSFPAEITVSAIQTNAHQIFIASARDITERKQAEEELQYQALHDALTGLPNRTLFRDRLQQAVLAARRARSSVALLLMDLNGFKAVNDTYGHHTGDLLLREVAERFRRSLRQSDTVGRLGGDEFALILPATSVEGAIEVADMIRNRLAEPFLVESKTLLVGASIGITVSPDHGANVNNLLRYADSAMYEAKRSGGGWLIYTPDGGDASLQDDLPIARGA